MSKSLFRWSFENQGKLYKIKSSTNSSILNKPLYISSYYSTLKKNKNVKCPTPDMLVKPGSAITQSNISNYQWSIEKNISGINRYYIKHIIGNNTLYLAVCKESGTVYLTSTEYNWDIINMTNLRKNDINSGEEYIIIDGLSTKILSLSKSGIVLSATFLWRLTQNPFQNINDNPDYSTDLAQYMSFFISGNVQKNTNTTSDNIYLRFKKNQINEKEQITLEGSEVDDSSNSSQQDINLFKWKISNNAKSIVNMSERSLIHSKTKQIFTGTSDKNTNWDIINITRSIGYRNNDLIIIESTLEDIKKTLIIDDVNGYDDEYKIYNKFKYIKTDSLKHNVNTKSSTSCMETKTLDLYIGKYNYAIDNIKRITSDINNESNKLKDHQTASSNKIKEINTLHSTLGGAIKDADSTHFGNSDELRSKLKSTNNGLQSDHADIKTNIHSTNKALNMMQNERDIHIKERDKWHHIITVYETECNKEDSKKKDETLAIHNYINNQSGMPEFFEPDITNIKNSTVDADTQINVQKNIIKEKNSILPIRTSMLENIIESNNIKRNLIYLTASIIIVLIVIIIITYVRNNKVYIDKSFDKSFDK